MNIHPMLPILPTLHLGIPSSCHHSKTRSPARSTIASSHHPRHSPMTICTLNSGLREQTCAAHILNKTLCGSTTAQSRSRHPRCKQRGSARLPTTFQTHLLPPTPCLYRSEATRHRARARKQQRQARHRSSGIAAVRFAVGGCGVCLGVC